MCDAQQCEHGNCLQHTSEWKVVELGRRPDPGVLGRMLCRINCCGMPMLRFIRVTKYQCQRCGATGKRIGHPLAYCPCCGKEIDVYCEPD